MPMLKNVTARQLVPMKMETSTMKRHRPEDRTPLFSCSFIDNSFR